MPALRSCFNCAFASGESGDIFTSARPAGSRRLIGKVAREIDEPKLRRCQVRALKLDPVKLGTLKLNPLQVSA